MPGGELMMDNECLGRKYQKRQAMEELMDLVLEISKIQNGEVMYLIFFGSKLKCREVVE